MSFWLSLIGYQAVWFAAVIGAGHGMAWPGVASMLVYAVVQLTCSRNWRTDLTLMAAAVLFGFLLDGTLIRSGLASYAAGWPSVAVAPAWILALWVGFALTLNHSLAYLAHRTVVATIAGAIVGPISYWSAGRAFGAVTLGVPFWQTVLALSFGWAFAMLVLSLVARRSLHSSTTENPHSLEQSA